jgi:hypothetical protein
MVNYGRGTDTAMINLVTTLIAHKNNPATSPMPSLGSNAHWNAYSVAQLTDVRNILIAEHFVPTSFVCTIEEIDPSNGSKVRESDHNITRSITNNISGNYFVK